MPSQGWLDPFWRRRDPDQRPRSAIWQFLEGPLFLAAIGAVLTIVGLWLWKLPPFVLAAILYGLAVYRSELSRRQQIVALVLMAAVLGILWRAVRPPQTLPQGFLQFDAFEVLKQYSVIEAGRQFAVSIYSRNPGPTKVFDALGYSHAFVEDVDDSTDHRVLAEFERQFEPLRKRYVSGQIKSPEQGIGRELWTTVFTDPLTQHQVDGIVNGTTTIYLVSWLGWTDAQGQQAAFDCRWLQKFEHFPYSREDVVWHYCRG